MTKSTLLALGLVAALATTGLAAEKKEAKDVPPTLAFEVKSLDGEKVDLSKYLGKVVLIVNTASECGLTTQYEGLQAMHEKYGKDGLAVLGFPCNQFGKQEPGSAKEISKFCTENYGVTFDMFEKVDINGDDAAPLFKYLTSEKTNPKFAGPIKWNFGKFLVDREGNVVARFEPTVAPESKELTAAVSKELEKK